MAQDAQHTVNDALAAITDHLVYGEYKVGSAIELESDRGECEQREGWESTTKHDIEFEDSSTIDAELKKRYNSVDRLSLIHI